MAAGSDNSTPPGNASLMALVVGILGTALILLIVIDLLTVMWGRAIPAELNTLTSLIAGGLIGFLTPHAVASLPRSSPPVAHADSEASSAREHVQSTEGGLVAGGNGGGVAGMQSGGVLGEDHVPPDGASHVTSP